MVYLVLEDAGEKTLTKFVEETRGVHNEKKGLLSEQLIKTIMTNLF